MYDTNFCRNCKRSKAVAGTEQYLCEKKGLVSGSHHCRSFALDLFKLKAKRLRTLDTTQFFPEDFSIE